MSSAKGYGQFCPVARTAEVLAERWTPLVVRELLSGAVRFNDIQRGVPRMSPSLLSRRLKELEYAGVVERRQAEGRGWEYHLTAPGHELMPIIETMGAWSQRWLRQDLVADENLDPDLLMWDIRRRAIASEVPISGRFIVRFQFAGVPASHRLYWLVFNDGEADLCIKDPGHEVDLHIAGALRLLTQIWLGHVTLDEALADERLELDGRPRDIKAFRRWFALSVTAPAARAAISAEA